jgi:hypothetical protein
LIRGINQLQHWCAGEGQEIDDGIFVCRLDEYRFERLQMMTNEQLQDFYLGSII